MPEHALLFEPHECSSRTFAHRAVVAPMTRVSANADGVANETMLRYYRRFARGGFAAVITEGNYIDAQFSQTYLHQPGLVTPEHVASWQPIVAAVQREGSLMIAQLQHSGPQGQGNPHAHGVKGPASIPARGQQLSMYRGEGPYATPEALSLSEIHGIREAFVHAALRAHEAGFDGIEVHGANGYLLDAFHTDYLNTRDDEYGGSPARRVKLTAEVVRAIAERLPSDFIVGVRVSQAKVSDTHHTWSGGIDEARVIFEALAHAGTDYIHTSEYNAASPAFPDADPRSLARLARDFAPGVTIIANGHVHTGDDATTLIKHGHAHLVSLGKAALSNPDWPTRVRNNGAVDAAFATTRFGTLATIQEWELS